MHSGVDAVQRSELTYWRILHGAVGKLECDRLFLDVARAIRGMVVHDRHFASALADPNDPHCFVLELDRIVIGVGRDRVGRIRHLAGTGHSTVFEFNENECKLTITGVGRQMDLAFGAIHRPRVGRLRLRRPARR